MHSKYKDYRKDTQLHDTPRHGHRHCLVHRHKVALALALAVTLFIPFSRPRSFSPPSKWLAKTNNPDWLVETT